MTISALASQSQDPQLLNSSGDLFLLQFEETREEDDIDNALSAYELVIGMMSTDHEKYGGCMAAVGLVWYRRFEVFGNFGNIENASNK